jgi:uncharacterized protein YqgC (DUF456 family)
MDLDFLGWFLMALLVLLGLVGSVLPGLPGTMLIAASSLVYQFWLAGDQRKLGAWTMGGIFGLMVLSYGIDFAASVWGAKRFGASWWGLIGGGLGLLVGLFFSLPGLLLGPPLGVWLGEWLGGCRAREAVRVAWGTVVGAAVGMALRLAIAGGMTVWLGVAVWRAMRG